MASLIHPPLWGLMCRNQRLNLTHTRNTRPLVIWCANSTFLERPKCSHVRLRVCREVCQKPPLPDRQVIYLSISKGACKTLLGRIKRPLRQSCSCAGLLVQPSRLSLILFEGVENPAPHELCFTRLSLNKSEKRPSLISCVKKASQGLAGVTVGQHSLFSFKEGLDPGMLSGGGGARNSSSGNWKEQHEASSECILSAWGEWHGERQRMEREE